MFADMLALPISEWESAGSHDKNPAVLLQSVSEGDLRVFLEVICSPCAG